MEKKKKQKSEGCCGAINEKRYADKMNNEQNNWSAVCGEVKKKKKKPKTVTDQNKAD